MLSNSHVRIRPRRKPLTTMPLFIAAHDRHETRIPDYHHIPRRRSVLLSSLELEDLEPLGATLLRSNNVAARISFARTASEHMARFVEELDDTVPLAFVTLASKRFAFAERDAAAFDVKPLMRWTREVLAGLNFVGMVEAALYTNVGAILGGPDRVVSFHTHAVVWGATAADLDALIMAVNADESALVPGISPGHWRPLRRAEVSGQVIYMSKNSLSDHRIYAKRSEVIDEETGEITAPTTGAFRQKKDPLRPADAVRMFRVMRDRHIDQLAFAGGDGAAVLTAIRHEALRAWRIYKLYNHL